MIVPATRCIKGNSEKGVLRRMITSNIKHICENIKACKNNTSGKIVKILRTK